MRSRLVGLVTAVCAAVALAGCAPASAPVPSATPTATPTTSPTATAEPTPSDTPAPATIVFDGVCDEVLPPDAVEDILGPGARPAVDDSTAPTVALFRAALASTGGVSCSWNAGAAGTLTASILPVEIISADLLERTEPMSCAMDGGVGNCTVAVAAGDTWLQVSAQGETVAQRALAAVGARIVDEHPVAATFPADAWAVPACDEVVDVVRSSVADADITEGYPSDANPGGMLWDALTAHGSVAYCGAASRDEKTGVRVRLYPGFAADALRSLGLETTEGVAGADEAFTFAPEEGPPAVLSIVGDNVINVSGFGDVDLLRLSDAVIERMHPRPPAS